MRDRDEIDLLGVCRRLRAQLDVGQSGLRSSHVGRAWRQLGVQYQDLARYADAAHCFRRALEQRPQDQQSRHLLCFALERMNRLEELQEIIDLGDAVGDASPRHAFNRATLAYRQGDMEAARACIVTRFEDQFGAAPPRLAAAAHFLRGNIEDKAQNYDEAFDWWSLANNIVRQSLLAKRLEPRAHEFRANFVDRARRLDAGSARAKSLFSAPADSPPVFLVGFPRSGTTLLRRLLGAHTQVLDLEEKPLFQATWDEFEHPHAAAVLSQLDRSALRAQQRRYFETARRFGVRASFRGVLLDKFPLMITALDLVHRVFPNARIIVALRHPADVIISNFSNGFKWNPAMWHSLDLMTLTEFYSDTMAAYQAFRRHLPLRCLEVRYESLVADPQRELRRAFDFMGLPWQERVLTQHLTRANEDVSTPSYHQVVRPVYRSSVGRGRSYAKRLEPVAHVIEKVARSLGYSYAAGAASPMPVEEVSRC